MGDLCVEVQAAGQLQADHVVVAMALYGADLAVQLVARAGAQHQAAQQVEVAGRFVRAKDLGLKQLQALIEAQHPFAFLSQFGAATALATDAALHQRFLRQVVQLINGVPGGLVTQPGTLGRTGDGALLGDMPQQGNTLGAADDVLAERAGHRHGRYAWVRCADVAALAQGSQVSCRVWAYGPGNTRPPGGRRH